ncbi:MAG: hypothetical protein WAU60_15910 [Candidatus Competibacter denitrificans]|jgi:ADP-ribose pyrophosphatase YjhB (NUDIX family)
MTNLTISIDDELLKRARIRALEEDTSVNAVLADYLRIYAHADELQRQRQVALAALLALAEQGQARREARTWTREELHER